MGVRGALPHVQGTKKLREIHKFTLKGKI